MFKSQRATESRCVLSHTVLDVLLCWVHVRDDVGRDDIGRGHSMART